MTFQLYSRKNTISRVSKVFLAAIMVTVGTGMVHAQARQEVSYDFSPNQFTGLYERTFDDYKVLNDNGSSSRIQLNGGVAEYSWRHYYPFEIVGRASYSSGQPLGQKLLSVTAGAGYTRQIFRRYFPFARVTAGIAHTSSSNQYLATGGINGFAFNVDGGLDIDLKQHRWGVRAIELQNQYLPFGVNNLGSVYWSLGAGAYVRFGK